MYLVAVILKNGRHFEFWNFFRWLTGFIKRAISKEYVCQFWCLFPEMKDSFTYLPHYCDDDDSVSLIPCHKSNNFLNIYYFS